MKLRIVSTDFLALFLFSSIYASTAAKSYILNYMLMGANFIIKGCVRPYGCRLAAVALT